MTSPRHRRSPRAAPGAAAAPAPRYSPTIQILPGEPDTTILRTTAFPPPVADEPAPVMSQARPATAGELTVTTDGAWRVFGGRPLSPSATVRAAWFRANPGPEQIFSSTLADLEAMWLLDTSLPVPPRARAAADAAEDTEDPVSVAATGTDGPPHRPAATETVNDPGPEDESAEHDGCAEGPDAA